MIKEFLKKHTPVIGYLELTLACNVKCVHCYLEGGHNNVPNELSLEEIDNLLDQMAELGVLIIVLTGGEIFLRKDLFKIMEKVRAKGFALVLFTNGTFITEEMCKPLYDLAPLGIEISLHGSNAKVHENITGVKGSFDKTVNAIKLIKKSNLKVKLKCSVLKSNVNDIENVKVLAKKLDVEYTFDPFIFPGRDQNLEQTKERINKEELKKFFLDKDLPKPVKCTEELTYMEMPEKQLCGAGSDLLTISSNGDIYPCIPLKLKAGNIRKNSLKKIWNNSKALKKIRNYKVKHLKECGSCKLKKNCTKCMAISYNENGELLACSSLSKEIAEVRFDIKKIKEKIA